MVAVLAGVCFAVRIITTTETREYPRAHDRLYVFFMLFAWTGCNFMAKCYITRLLGWRWWIHIDDEEYRRTEHRTVYILFILGAVKCTGSKRPTSGDTRSLF